MFVFEDKFYTQKNGLAMGRPLLLIFADTIMDYIETKILANPELKFDEYM